MKRFVIAMLFAATLLVGASSSWAQGDVTKELEITRADIQAGRKELVAENLPLSEEQAAAFWPLYREYRAEMDKVGDGNIALITSFAKSYETLTDEQAAGHVKQFLDLEKTAGEVRRKYASKLGKILPGKTVMRFFQIENKLDAIIKAALVDEIPLAK